MTRLLTALMLMALLPSAYAETFRFYGYAFDLESGDYLYTEVHKQVIEDDVWQRGRIDYYGPDNTLMGTKELDFADGEYVPVYRLELPYKDYAEGISAVGDQVTLFKEVKGQREEKVIDRTDNLAADSGFHSFLRDNFQALMEGDTVRMRLAVAGNLDSYKFRGRKVSDTEFNGQPAVAIKVELDSLLRLLVDDLYLVYEPKERKLLEYRGISNVHDPRSGDPYNVRIVYPGTPPDGAPENLPPLEQ